MKSSLNNMSKIPCIASHCLDPLHHLEERLLSYQVTIEAWLREQWRSTFPPFYSSVDLRNAGFKLAPVDTNLFPGGFNNLKGDSMSLAVQAVQETLDRLAPGCRRLLLVPEDHTRNQFYFENLVVLRDILIQAGFEVRIGSLSEDLAATHKMALTSGRTLLIEKVRRQDQQLMLDNFLPCLILLNNDLADGIPKLLQNLQQRILPMTELGWHRRLKSGHFREYDRVCQELSELIQLDPWLINPLFTRCEGIDFMKRSGESCMVEASQDLLAKIQKKYNEYQIKEKPYVVIKADAGTYGMGVLSIHDPSEIKTLNRKKRVDMTVTKGRLPIKQVIIQEGVYTFEIWQGAVAEPVVYLFGQYVVGGFYRVHTGRGITDNLNSPGMQFESLPFVKACNTPEIDKKQEGQYANRFYVYGVIARLAVLAAAREQLIALTTG